VNNLIVIPERIFTTQEEIWFMQLVTKNISARLLYLWKRWSRNVSVRAHDICVHN